MRGMMKHSIHFLMPGITLILLRQCDSEGDYLRSHGGVNGGGVGACVEVAVAFSSSSLTTSSSVGTNSSTFNGLSAAEGSR